MSKAIATTTPSYGLNWYSVGVLGISVIAVSSIISLYVLSVARLNLKDVDTDPIERAATGAVRDLTGMTVQTSDFGQLGLLDRGTSSPASTVRSFDTVAGLIRDSIFIADQYHLAVMQERARADFGQLAALRADFRDRLKLAVTQGTIYRAVRKTVESGIKPTQKLLSLSLKLGQCRTLPYDASVEALPGESGTSYVVNNRLKTMVPVPVGDATSGIYYFSQKANKLERIKTQDFLADDGHSLPSALLVEATISSPDKKTGQNQTLIRSTCMLLGPYKDRQSLFAETDNNASCLALSFPHGKIDSLSSLADVLSEQKDNRWLKDGAWQICADGTIPGGGHLAPTVRPIVREMPPRQVLSLLVYHFILGQKSSISPVRLQKLFTTKFPALKPDKKTLAQKEPFLEREVAGSDEIMEVDQVVDSQVGSCLVQESDAREFAYLYKGGSQEAGAKAIAQSFASSQRLFPPSALPLNITRDGGAILPGQNTFDRDLALSLLTSLYDTNLAANDTLATAQIMQKGAVRALKECRDRLYLHNSDLSYLKNQQLHVDKKTQPDEYKDLEDKIDSAQSRLSYETRQEKLLVNVMYLAQRASNNAYLAAKKSFTCGAQLIKIADSGINRPDMDKTAFVLGKRFIFKPITEELSETTIYEKAQEMIDNPGAKLDSPWFDQKLNIFGSSKAIYQKPDTKVMVDGQSLSELRAQDLNNRVNPTTLVFDGNYLRAESKSPCVLVFNQSPFTTVNLKNGQLVYYCQDALTTGSPPASVRWSVLARDCHAYIDNGLAFDEQKSYQSSFDGPVDPAWCKRADNFDPTTMPDLPCPQLSGEWQLRAPLVPADSSLQKVLKGATLTNPENGQRVPQVPPAGVDLM